MSAKQRIALHICGSDYFITTDEPESYVRELGEMLDRSMRNVMRGDPRVSTTMAAVLSGIMLADEARKAGSSADNLRVQLKEYLSENARARAEADQARRDAEAMRAELDELRRKFVPGYRTGESGGQPK